MNADRRRAGGTLKGRLLLSSTLWLAVALLTAGLLLAWLFRGYIQRRFDAQLNDHLEELVAAAEVAPSPPGTPPSIKLTWSPADPRFSRPRSGWYWQVRRRDGHVLVQSGSLYEGDLELTGKAHPVAHVMHMRGPGGLPLRALVQLITYPESIQPFVFVVAGPVRDIDSDVARFGARLAITLALLWVGLMVAVVAQVRYGLKPLAHLQAALAAVRGGRAERLPSVFPAELEPVVDELNALLAHNAVLLERARTEAGNLAHALKTPISVMRNELRALHGERRDLLCEQLATVSERLEHHLARARAAGTVRLLGARAPVEPVAADVRFSLERLHADRHLTMELHGLAALAFRGDADDLAEMLGNLMDNACKWARTRVLVSGAPLPGNMLELRVEDDGPGIAPADRERVLQRGRRLDESVPGSGLGLHIVEELAVLYGGTVTLDQSTRLGGLSARLALPAALAA